MESIVGISLPLPRPQNMFSPTPNLGKEFGPGSGRRFQLRVPSFLTSLSIMAPASSPSSPRSSGPDYTLLMPILLAPLIPLVGLSLRRRPQLAVPVGLCTSGIVLLGAHHSGLSVSTRE